MNPNLTANLRADRALKLSLIRDKLATAQPYLTEAIDLIHSLGLAQSYSELYSNIADAHFHCGEAISQIEQHPEPNQ
jgi:hypothetical protein